MKYEIKEIDKSKTIANFNKKDGYIEVKYLDGTSDIFQRTEENLKNIAKIMENQASEYVKAFGFRKIKLENRIRGCKTILILSIIGFIIALSTMAYAAPGFELLMSLLATLGFGVGACVNIIDLVKSNNKLQDLEKYHLFINNVREKVQDFEEIITTEKVLTKSTEKQKESINLNNLDKYSLQDLKDILLKIERYSTVANLKDIDVKENEQPEKTLSKVKK